VAGFALSAGLLALWALSRTAGLPIGPEAWEAEPAELLDVAAGVAEFGIILLATMSLTSPRRSAYLRASNTCRSGTRNG
jgi:hypothetical protein